MDEMFAAMRDSLLRGPLAENVAIDGEPARAFVHRNIELIGEYGQVAGRRTEIEIPSGAAKLGDTVTVGVRAYVLASELADDDLFARFVLAPA